MLLIIFAGQFMWGPENKLTMQNSKPAMRVIL